MPHPGLLQLHQFPGERGRDNVEEGLLLAAQTAGRDDRLGKVPQRGVLIDSHLLSDSEGVWQVLRDVPLPANKSSMPMPTGVISRPSRPASSVTISIPRASKSHQTAIGRSFIGLRKFTTPSVVDPLPQTQSQVSVTSGRRQTYWNVSAFSTTSTPRTSRSICPMTWMP